jgi:hypothetical protein
MTVTKDQQQKHFLSAVAFSEAASADSAEAYGHAVVAVLTLPADSDLLAAAKRIADMATDAQWSITKANQAMAEQQFSISEVATLVNLRNANEHRADTYRRAAIVALGLDVTMIAPVDFPRLMEVISAA